MSNLLIVASYAGWKLPENGILYLESVIGVVLKLGVHFELNVADKFGNTCFRLDNDTYEYDGTVEGLKETLVDAIAHYLTLSGYGAEDL